MLEEEDKEENGRSFVWRDGGILMGKREKREVLNACFASVFPKENSSDGRIKEEGKELLSNIENICLH